MMDVSEDLYPSHDNRTVDTPLGGADIWPYQQFDRATDRADGSASVAGAAATPSARQLGSSTDSCSEPLDAGGPILRRFPTMIADSVTTLMERGPWRPQSCQHSPGVHLHIVGANRSEEHTSELQSLR